MTVKTGSIFQRFLLHDIQINFLIILVLFSTGFDSSAQRLRRHQPNGAYGKPNIILLAADNFTCSDLDTVRKSPSEFPNLNRILTNGISFTRFYNAGFKHEEVYASYIYGAEQTTSSSSNRNYLNANNLSLARKLKECEYYTGVLGKWLLGNEVNDPVNKGFREWFGFLTSEESTNLFPAFIWRNESQFFLAANRNGAKGVSAQHWFNITTTNFLRVYQEYPFFLYLPSILPGRSLDSSNSQFVDNKQVISTKSQFRHKSLKELDDYLGLILNYLKIFKISDKTMILFTGISNYDSPGKNPLKASEEDFKQLTELIETNLRAPLIIYWEGKLRTSFTNNSLLISYDVYPTIIQLADGKFPTNNYSYSFVDQIFTKTNSSSPEFVFWKLKDTIYDLVFRFNGYFAGYSEKTKSWNFQSIENEKDTKFTIDDARRLATEFLQRTTNGLPRIKSQPKTN